MKKNTTAEKAILDAQKAAKAIKENTDKSLQELMNNAIAKLVMESDDEPEDDKDSYEVEDVKTEDEPKDSDDAAVDGTLKQKRTSLQLMMLTIKQARISLLLMMLKVNGQIWMISKLMTVILISQAWKEKNFSKSLDNWIRVTSW